MTDLQLLTASSASLEAAICISARAACLYLWDYFLQEGHRSIDKFTAMGSKSTPSVVSQAETSFAVEAAS